MKAISWNGIRPRIKGGYKRFSAFVPDATGVIQTHMHCCMIETQDLKLSGKHDNLFLSFFFFLLLFGFFFKLKLYIRQENGS